MLHILSVLKRVYLCVFETIRLKWIVSARYIRTYKWEIRSMFAMVLAKVQTERLNQKVLRMFSCCSPVSFLRGCIFFVGSLSCKMYSRTPTYTPNQTFSHTHTRVHTNTTRIHIPDGPCYWSHAYHEGFRDWISAITHTHTLGIHTTGAFWISKFAIPWAFQDDDEIFYV